MDPKLTPCSAHALSDPLCPSQTPGTSPQVRSLCLFPLLDFDGLDQGVAKSVVLPVDLIVSFFCLFLLVVLGIELRASRLLGMWSFDP
jgi:hypothetical protein